MVTLALHSVVVPVLRSVAAAAHRPVVAALQGIIMEVLMEAVVLVHPRHIAVAIYDLRGLSGLNGTI
jgi:hypothetical protein